MMRYSSSDVLLAMILQSLAASVIVCCGPPASHSATMDPHEFAKSALVIGNGNYAAVGSLKNPSNDAEDICKVLREIGYQTSCFTDIRSRVQFKSVVQDYTETLSPNTVSIIYYAGHAVQINGENYLIPTEAQLQSAESVVDEAMDLSYFMNQLRQTDSYLKIVILDACRNNPIRSSSQPLAQGLAQITDIPDGTLVLYATAANELALDGAGRNGILTKNLLAHIKDEGSIDDLFKRVSLGVQTDASAFGHSQKPSLYTNFTGQYCFIRCTDVERLQKQREESEQRIMELETRVNAGDEGAKTELAAALVANKDLIAQIRKKDELALAAEKASKNRERMAVVPPSF
jgi:uncharacterized caspase-like protein